MGRHGGHSALHRLGDVETLPSSNYLHLSSSKLSSRQHLLRRPKIRAEMSILPLASPSALHHNFNGVPNNTSRSPTSAWDSSRVPVVFRRILRFQQMVCNICSRLYANVYDNREVGFRACCMAAYISVPVAQESVSMSLPSPSTTQAYAYLTYRYRNVYFHKRKNLPIVLQQDPWN